jgi:hypothetical protein
LVAFEDEYRAYGEALTEALRMVRPRAAVSSARADDLPEAVARLHPDLTISSRPDPGGVTAWVELSMEPERPSRVRVGERRSETTNPDLDLLLSIVDEVEGLAEAGNGAEED